MAQIIWTDPTLSNLNDIADYISLSNFEAAQGLIRERGLRGKVDLLAFYMTPGVYTGIKRGFILAAPADSMVVQGRIAIDQAVRILEGKEYVKHVGPKIFVVDPQNINDVSRENILPPEGYKPVFSVK